MKCPHCSHEWTPDKGELLSDLGRHGGKATSRKKARAAKLNAKLGGWPKGKKRKPRKVANHVDANQVAHGVVAAAEKITQQERPPQPLKVLPSPKAPKRARSNQRP